MPETLLTPARGKTPPGGAEPDHYADFRLPDELGIDPDTAEDFTALARDLGLPPDGARRLIDLYAQAKQRLHEGWRNQTMGDRELGGHGLARNVATANRAIDRFGGPALRQALDATGAGNHPEIVRFFTRVGKSLAEDGLVRPTHGRQAKSYAETFYPKHKSKE